MNELNNKIAQILTSSNLHIEAIYYVVKDIYRDVEELYKRYLLEKEEIQQDSEEKANE